MELTTAHLKIRKKKSPAVAKGSRPDVYCFLLIYVASDNVNVRHRPQILVSKIAAKPL